MGHPHIAQLIFIQTQSTGAGKVYGNYLVQAHELQYIRNPL